MVGLGRVELPTSPLSGVRSSHLSYRPGINWWSWSGSNRRPPECKSGALPAELQPLHLKSGVIHAALQRKLSRPIGRRRRLKGRSGKQVTETLSGDPRRDLDWKGCHLLTTERPAYCSTARLFADSVTPATF